MNLRTMRLAIHVLLWGGFLMVFIAHLSMVAGRPLPLFLFAVLVTGWTLVDLFLSVFLSSIVYCGNCGAARERGESIGIRNCPKCDDAAN